MKTKHIQLSDELVHFINSTSDEQYSVEDIEYIEFEGTRYINSRPSAGTQKAAKQNKRSYYNPKSHRCQTVWQAVLRGLFVGSIVAGVLIPLGIAERGYFAVGGDVVAAAVTAVMVFAGNINDMIHDNIRRNRQ